MRQQSIDRINKLCPDQVQIRQTVYLLRGLLCQRILISTLRKRWNVEYGLHPARDPIAVPYLAKGVPSEQSEYGHCDVAILLTCLSFYHGGLNQTQTREAIEQVLKSDDPASLYEKWIDETLPQYLRDWRSLNVDDPQQLAQIWTCVRYRIPVIDYYLNTFVFPRHAKQFKVKIQSNGWDLPLVSSRSGVGGMRIWDRYRTQMRKSLPTFCSQGRENTSKLQIGPEVACQKSNSCSSFAEVALYFEGDKPMIVSKQGAKTPLLATPYADNLDGVLVYLDEVHTRGTDLKFGPDARGALTLGLSQTKDKTVQAAMRLRQLGTTQQVTFYAPPEVDRSIRDVCKKKDHQWIQSPDVLEWLMRNTCDGIEALQPLYYAQGTDYCRRKQAEMDYSRFVADDDERNAYDTGAAVHASALQEVEQERETEYEIELVRQVKRPPPYSPCKFPGLHRDLGIFARTGRIPGGSDWFVPMYHALSRTGLGRKYRVRRDHVGFPLYLSGEFEKTVKVVVESYSDQFMRPVQWVLYSPSPETAIMVTPEEAEELIPVLMGTEAPTYLLTYATPVTRRMACFNSLKFFSVPPLPDTWEAPPELVVELGLFAGRLYFDWNEYPTVCRVLGIDEGMVTKEEFDFSTEQETASAGSSNETSIPVVDGPAEVTSTRRNGHQEPSGFTSKPFTFTREWLSVRRRGQDIAYSPMGFIASGKPLHADLPFFQFAREGAGVTHSLFAPLSAAAAAAGVGGDQEAPPGFAVAAAGHDEGMDVGNYDADAELRDDEVNDEIEYEEADKYQETEKD
ncbi:hypothetical protein PG987_009795 [Apiospora arundinis]